jgi:hypothetical protein
MTMERLVFAQLTGPVNQAHHSVLDGPGQEVFLT